MLSVSVKVVALLLHIASNMDLKARNRLNTHLAHLGNACRDVHNSNKFSGDEITSFLS